MCGNYDAQEVRETKETGSPPRVRELRDDIFERGLLVGITPACAGITFHIFGIVVNFKDHPRVCGNYTNIFFSPFSFLGSPPRVRELPVVTGYRPFGNRITPACAGITDKSFRSYAVSQDHPRVCGNYGRGIAFRQLRQGSPPRVRELLDSKSENTGAIRITPACAGITYKEKRSG